MRIVFDGYWWHSGPPSGRLVVTEFVAAWAREFPADDVVLTIPSTDSRTVEDTPPGVVVHRVRSPQHAVSVVAEMPHVVRRYRADIAFCQNYTPLGGPAATFIHDVLFQTNPEWFTRAERWYLRPIPTLARRAATVLASSESEAARIRRLNPRLAAVVPVGLAVSSRLKDVDRVRPSRMPEVDRYLLTVGRLNVRKNLGFTLEAAVRSGWLSPRSPFVVVGESDGRGEALSERVRAAIARKEILFLGGVPDGELAWLYSNAELFVFLTRDEGYGLPPIEAQWFGCPVLVSDIPVMREVCGESARYVSLQTHREAATAILAALQSPHENRRDRDAMPTWGGVVRKTRDAFAAAIERER